MIITDSIAHRRKSDGNVQPVAEHLLNVAQLSRRFASKIRWTDRGQSSSLADVGELVGLLHDLGKYSSAFQAYIKSAEGLIDPDADDYVDATGLKGKIDHSTAGGQLIWHRLGNSGGIARAVGNMLALVTVSHHSGLIDCLSPDAGGPPRDSFGRRVGKDDARTHLRESLSNVDSCIRERVEEILLGGSLPASFRSLLEAIRATEVGVNKGAEQRIQFKCGLLARFLFSCLIDADRIDSADFENPDGRARRSQKPFDGWSLLCQRLEKTLARFPSESSVDKARRRVSDECLSRASGERGIFTLTVPTGGGKTLASLRFALNHARIHGMERVLYVVPFTTIIDQNVNVVRPILEVSKDERGRIVLEHHSNLTSEKQRWRDKVLAESWDVPVVFTTNVQFLESLFGSGTRGARRMHQLANAVIVFDEIQSLPIECVHLFNNAVNFLIETCGSSVVLCTATQPLLHRVESALGALKLDSRSEIIDDVPGLFASLRRVEVLDQRKTRKWTDGAVAEFAVSEAKRVGSCLVVVNTKRAAREVFLECRGHSRDADLAVFHLSTSMCPAHREKVLGEVRDRLAQTHPVPIVCVSTQLIEAGVDVDFGSVIRFIAGLDSVAQASGRCNRHGKRPIGKVHIIEPAVESVSSLRAISEGQEKTRRILDDCAAGVEPFGANLCGPEAISRFFEYYFFARAGEMAYRVASRQIGHDDTLLNLLSNNPLVVNEYRTEYREAPTSFFRQSFMTAAKAFKAIDAPTRGVVVPFSAEGKEIIGNLCAAFDVGKLGVLLMQAQRFTVNVFESDLKELDRLRVLNPIQDGSEILYLSDERYYDADFGLCRTPSGEMEVLIG